MTIQPKYELLHDDSIEVNGHTLYRIRALVKIITHIEAVRAGDSGIT